MDLYPSSDEVVALDTRIEGWVAGLQMAATGKYTFSCQHPDGSDQPKYVLAFGQNLGWEFMRSIARSIAGAAGSILGSLVIMVAAGIAAMVITAVVAIRRRRGS